jgi:hypothetical protein
MRTPSVPKRQPTGSVTTLAAIHVIPPGAGKPPIPSVAGPQAPPAALAGAPPAPARTPRKGRKGPPDLHDLAFDIRADVGQVRAIAYTLNDLEYQYYSPRSQDHLDWLKYVLLDSLSEKCDVLARLTKQLETHPAARLTMMMFVIASFTSTVASAQVPVREWMAYHPGFLGGAAVAVCDLDGDHVPEVVTGPGPGGGAHVRVFTLTGQPRAEWLAHPETFTGGVHVACAAGLVFTAPSRPAARTSASGRRSPPS